MRSLPDPLTATGTGAIAPAAEPVPVPARSVVASILLPLERPALPVRSLVRCCELFGIAEGTTRVALSRMVAAGELRASDGTYRLAGRLLVRHDQQATARRPQVMAWSGSWVGAVVVAERRSAADRATLRHDLARSHLAELRSGLWVRPDNLPGLAATVSALGEPVAGHCLWLRAQLAVDIDAPDDAALVAQLWDLPVWAAEARRLVAELDATLPELTAGRVEALTACFTVAAGAVRHIVADPLLPRSLLDEHWPGDALRSRYDIYERAYRHLLADWLR